MKFLFSHAENFKSSWRLLHLWIDSHFHELSFISYQLEQNFTQVIFSSHHQISDNFDLLTLFNVVKWWNCWCYRKYQISQLECELFLSFSLLFSKVRLSYQAFDSKSFSFFIFDKELKTAKSYNEKNNDDITNNLSWKLMIGQIID